MALTIGLTGGIAAGKSAVAARLSQLGSAVVDADQVSRDLMVAGSPLYREVLAAFGPEVTRPDGSLDRARLGQLVFGSPPALARLNAIAHPAIWKELEKLMRQAARSSAVVTLVAPLLLEHNAQDRVDQVWVVDLPEELQLQRLMARDGIDLEAARARIASQMSRQERLLRADAVLDNSASLEATIRQVEKLWQSRVMPHFLDRQRCRDARH